MAEETIRRPARPREERPDFRQRMTNLLIEQMEAEEGLPWERPWSAISARPFNPLSGVRYRGGNHINLLLEQAERGSTDPRWMTMKQANAAGFSIRPGAKAVYVEYWDFGDGKPVARKKADKDSSEEAEPVDAKASEDDDDKVFLSRPKPRVFYAKVFNGEDVVGLPALDTSQANTWEPHALADQLFAATGAVIHHKGIDVIRGEIRNAGAAYYHPAKDEIVMPMPEQFNSVSDYYATKLHELGHWTGHESRLGRFVPGEQIVFGSESYAREELRAELTAFYLNTMLGIEGNVQGHARYLNHWIDVLKKDKHEIFRAARDAEQALNCILDFAPEVRAELDAAMKANVIRIEKVAAADKAPALPEAVDASPESVDVPVVEAPEAAAPEIGSEEIGAPAGDQPTAASAEDAAGDELAKMSARRWDHFQEHLRSLASEAGINEQLVELALEVVAPNFESVMSDAEKRRISINELEDMVTQSLMDELRSNQARHQRWDNFHRIAHELGDPEHGREVVEIALAEMAHAYNAVLIEGISQRHDEGRIDERLRHVVYGDAGRRIIDARFVSEIVNSSVAVAQFRAGNAVPAIPSPAVIDIDALPLNDGYQPVSAHQPSADLGEIDDEVLPLSMHQDEDVHQLEDAEAQFSNV